MDGQVRRKLRESDRFCPTLGRFGDPVHESHPILVVSCLPAIDHPAMKPFGMSHGDEEHIAQIRLTETQGDIGRSLQSSLRKITSVNSNHRGTVRS